MLELALRHMETMGSKASASSSAEGNNGRYRRRTNVGNLEKAKVEDNHGGGREVSPGEHWFTMETSQAEHRALFQLEKELEVTLLFKHRGSYRANPLLVT